MAKYAIGLHGRYITKQMVNQVSFNAILLKNMSGEMQKTTMQDNYDQWTYFIQNILVSDLQFGVMNK